MEGERRDEDREEMEVRVREQDVTQEILMRCRGGIAGEEEDEARLGEGKSG